MAEKLVRSYHLSHKLSQSSIDAMFPSTVTLLPPDIARQIELDSQKASAAGDDKYVVYSFVEIWQYLLMSFRYIAFVPKKVVLSFNLI